MRRFQLKVFGKRVSKPHDPSTWLYICNECNTVMVFSVQAEK
jgi:hypothetical protein